MPYLPNTTGFSPLQFETVTGAESGGPKRYVRRTRPDGSYMYAPLKEDKNGEYEGTLIAKLIGISLNLA